MIHFEGIDIELPHHLGEMNKEWVNRSIKSYKKKTGEVFFLFCSDAYLFEMNVKHLNHNTYTDIITFDLSEDPDYIQGELYISLERVMENAVNQGVIAVDEIDRVMIHGVLHLIGFKDKQPEDAVVMRQQEDFCLSLRLE